MKVGEVPGVTGRCGLCTVSDSVISLWRAGDEALIAKPWAVLRVQEALESKRL